MSGFWHLVQADGAVAQVVTPTTWHSFGGSAAIAFARDIFRTHVRETMQIARPEALYSSA